MLHRFALALGVVALFAGTSAAQTTDEAPVKLEYAFEKDAVDFYKAKAAFKQKGGMGMKVNAELYLTQTGLAPEATVGKVKQQVVRVGAKGQIFGQDQEYDTAKPGNEEAAGMLPGIAKSLLKTKTMSVKPNGEVTKSDTEGGKAGKSMVNKLLGFESLPFDVFRLPEKAVKVGDSWTHEKSGESEDQMTGKKKGWKLTYTYTLKRLIERDGETHASVAIKIDPKFDSLPGAMGGKVVRAMGKGVATFNVTKKRLRSINYTIKIEGEQSMGEGEPQKIYVSQSLNMRRTDKDESKD